MQKTKLSFYLDVITVVFGTFFLTFACMRFYVKKLAACAVVAFLLSTTVGLLFYILEKRRRITYALSTQKQRKLKSSMMALSIMSDKALVKFFSTLLKKLEVPFIPQETYILLTAINAELRFCFSPSPVENGQIISLYKLCDEGRALVVAGGDFTQDTLELTQRFGGRITLITPAELFLTMTALDYFPDDSMFTATKPRLRFLPLSEIFTRRRAKQFLGYGILLELFSFIVIYPVYYVVAGGAMTMFAAICFFFGTRNIPPLPQNAFVKLKGGDG